MNIQIFGTKKCNDTKKAERFFKERRIPYQFIDLKEKYVLYKSVDLLSVIFEIIKFDYQSCIVLVGEISLICYSLEGNLIWKNSYRNTIFDWFVTDKGLSVVFENDEKWLITLKDGNGIRVE